MSSVQSITTTVISKVENLTPLKNETVSLNNDITAEIGILVIFLIIFVTFGIITLSIYSSLQVRKQNLLSSTKYDDVISFRSELDDQNNYGSNIGEFSELEILLKA